MIAEVSLDQMWKMIRLLTPEVTTSLCHFWSIAFPLSAQNQRLEEGGGE